LGLAFPSSRRRPVRVSQNANSLVFRIQPIGHRLCSARDMFTYRDLETWQKGMDLVEECYRVTASFPRSELYGLTSQVRRAAVSIPANIAEGHCRRTTGPYVNHVSIAIGSPGELETCIELAFRLGFLSRAESPKLQATCDSVGRLLNGLHRSLEHKASSNAESPPPAE
jgi:four helix bundle protein